MRILQLLRDEFTRWLFVLEWMTLTAGCLPQNRPTPPPPLSVKVWSKLLSLKSVICYILVCEKRMVVKASFVKKTLGTVFSFSELAPSQKRFFFMYSPPPSMVFISLNIKQLHGGQLGHIILYCIRVQTKYRWIEVFDSSCGWDTSTTSL